MKRVYLRAITTLAGGGELPDELASDLMRAMMAGGLEPPRVAAVLTALHVKGVTAGELAALARTMRAHATPLPGGGDRSDCIDTCGTGGSGLDTANTSTAVAFVLAAAGVRVVKHGGRSSSGRCGSADVLEALGVPMSLSPAGAAALLEGTGICFVFAPVFHPAMRHVAPVRRLLGLRTVFNLLGPLCNPARPGHQVLGVSDGRTAGPMAEALARLGVRRAMVVHGRDGLDELSPCAPTVIRHVEGGRVRTEELEPEHAGVPRLPPEAIRGGDVATNARILEEVLGGRAGPHLEHVALNAGAGLHLVGRAAGIRQGVELARELLGSGRPRDVFLRFRDAARAAARAA